MALDVLTYALSKKYTDNSIAGGGAIKGKNCVIDDISPITGGNRITFQWTLDNGTVQQTTMDVMNGQNGQDGAPGTPGTNGQDGQDGADGLGIKQVEINASNHLIVTYDDDSTDDAGLIATLKGDDGFSPTIVIKESTSDRYVLTITDENGSYDTPNLKGTGGGGGASAISDLTDVQLTNLSDGQILQWDNTLQKFVNVNNNPTITVDNELSAISENPVQNKVIKVALDAKANSSDLGTAAVLNVPSSGDAAPTEVVKGDDSRLTDSRNASDVYAWAKEATKPSYTASEVGAIASSEKGINNGVATLDSAGKIPSSQLPGSVDEIIEAASVSAFPATGEASKIYVALDTNKTYRWGGSNYVEISASIALGETAGTAYEGNKGAANAAAIAGIKDSANIDSFSDVETALSGKQDTISDLSTIRSGAGAGATAYQKPSSGIPKTDLESDVQTSLGKADTAIQSHQDISDRYSTSDDASTDLVDGDYIPFYDSSANVKKKSLWSNIKSVLKTYFDTLYSKDNWVDGQDKTIIEGATSVSFTVPNASLAYEPYFETADGSPVIVKNSTISGTTLTYTIKAITAAQATSNGCKAKLRSLV